ETIDKVLGGRAPGSAILEADTARTPGPGAHAPPPQTPGTAPPAPPAHATAPTPSATDYMVDQAKRATISMWLGIASVAIGWIYLGFLPGIPAGILGPLGRP